jgi:DnaJ-class molecular chaperone
MKTISDYGKVAKELVELHMPSTIAETVIEFRIALTSALFSAYQDGLAVNAKETRKTMEQRRKEQETEEKNLAGYFQQQTLARGENPCANCEGSGEVAAGMLSDGTELRDECPACRGTGAA